MQGIKKGLVELADMIADQQGRRRQRQTRQSRAADIAVALHILTPRSEHWHPPVITYSALTGTGLESSG